MFAFRTQRQSSGRHREIQREFFSLHYLQRSEYVLVIQTDGAIISFILARNLFIGFAEFVFFAVQGEFIFAYQDVKLADFAFDGDGNTFDGINHGL